MLLPTLSEPTPAGPPKLQFVLLTPLRFRRPDRAAPDGAAAGPGGASNAALDAPTSAALPPPVSPSRKKRRTQHEPPAVGDKLEVRFGDSGTAKVSMPLSPFLAICGGVR
jgi:hypothetical protein